MPKTLVNIITEDNPIPAYLFIKEKYEVGDRLMYISAKDTEDDLDALSDLFNVPATHIEEIVLKHNMDEFTYEKICRTVLGFLNPDVNYCVNLAGGTRYMALAVQQVFERFKSEFFYVQVEENLIVKSAFDDSIFNNDDYFFPIRHRMTVAEYLRAHEIKHDLGRYRHVPTRSKEASEYLYRSFSQNRLSDEDYKILEMLRNDYRKRNRIKISAVETTGDGDGPAIPGLSRFLYEIRFVPRQAGFINRLELEYLTGGWFEEYVYYLVKKYVKPQDIAMGIKISRAGVRHDNELDVVFTKGNKLFVIECKTGVKTERLFNEIVYKACAIKCNINYQKPFLNADGKSITITIDEGLIVKDFLSTDEERLLIDTHYQNENPEIRNAFIFCLYTGMRFCDVKDLTFGNFDFANHLVTYEQNKTKGHSSKSGVTLPLTDELLGLIGEQPESREKGDLVFMLPSHTMCLKALRRWTKRAGIDKHITWHCARHSFGTNMAATAAQKGISIRVVQDLMGHSNLRYTERYTRVMDEQKKAAMAELSKMMEG